MVSHRTINLSTGYWQIIITIIIIIIVFIAPCVSRLNDEIAGVGITWNYVYDVV